MVVTSISDSQPLNTIHFNTMHFNEILLVQLPSRLSVVEAVAFRNTFQNWVEQNSGLTKIILDFGHTNLIDSSGIGSLIGNFKAAKASNIQLVLWSLRPQVKLALSLAGLDRILPIEDHTEVTIPVDTRNQALHSSFNPSVQSPLKRAVDITAALIGLSFTGIVLIPIAIAIAIDSPGPILVRQQRCGLLGRRFYLWKFRSRIVNAEALQSRTEHPIDGVLSNTGDDTRVTSVGGFLHKTHLNKLPQFWNVLKGDMTLIGSRPPTPAELDQYEVHSWQHLDMKPGLIREWPIKVRLKGSLFEEVSPTDTSL